MKEKGKSLRYEGIKNYRRSINITSENLTGLSKRAGRAAWRRSPVTDKLRLANAQLTFPQRKMQFSKETLLKFKC